MKVKLSVITGPDKGKEFEFNTHETFLVGRSKDAHFQPSYDGPHFSGRHFLFEVNPPRCRIINLSKRDGTLLNGVRVEFADVADGDEIGAGHSTFKVRIIPPGRDASRTKSLPAVRPPAKSAIEDKLAYPAVPGYRIEAELGRGGMGIVYRAIRDSDGLPVAIRAITPVPEANREQIVEFLPEVRDLALLQHKNIVAFQDAGETDNLIYLVMDLVDGPNLSESLGVHGPYEVRTAVRMLCQVLGGLADAHAKGYVHGDIRPSNILISVDEGNKRVARLADFGLARAFETARLSGITMQGELCGTPAYMAPEQVTHYRDVKAAADQYSAAATLYKLLTGQDARDLPKDVGAALAKIVTTDPVPIRNRRLDLPSELAVAIHKALSRDPEERYPDIAIFRQALKLFA